MEEADNSKKKEPGTWMSFLVFGIAIAIILTGVVILEFDVHIVLLLALIFVCVVSATLGYSFDDLVEFMKKSLGQAMSAMIIFYWCYYCFLDFFRNSTNIDLLWIAIY